MLSRSGFIASSAALALSRPAGILAQSAPTPVRVILFGVASNLPVWCAISKGFFAKRHLNVTTTVTPSSIYMFQHLSAGDFDIAVTAMDNVVAYDEGQGAAPLPNPADFVAFMGGDSGLLSLYTRPGIKTYAALRDKKLAVDALTTGYAFVLRRMLAKNGVGDADYTLGAAGGTPRRYKALVDGTEYAGAMLTAPFDFEADAKGFTKLGSAIDVLGHYQAYTGVARRAWITANGDVLVRYIRGYLDALNWLYDPANKAETIALLESNAKVPAELAPKVYAEVVNKNGGLVPDGSIDVEGVRVVLSLRSEYGKPKKTFTDPMKYVDETYLEKARALS
jgi:ABC-type nitrate/sulfonate/bicarbonate transport system substrate-binding protein